jgi:acyl-CoA thioester hydrolase
LGAVLLREESIYVREVGMHERIRITVELIKATRDYSRYTIIQTIFKENGKVAAKVLIDGAWIDMQTRKVMPPFPEVVEAVVNQLPIHKDYDWVEASYYRFL